MDPGAPPFYQTDDVLEAVSHPDRPAEKRQQEHHLFVDGAVTRKKQDVGYKNQAKEDKSGPAILEIGCETQHSQQDTQAQEIAKEPIGGISPLAKIPERAIGEDQGLELLRGDGLPQPAECRVVDSDQLAEIVLMTQDVGHGIRRIPPR